MGSCNRAHNQPTLYHCLYQPVHSKVAPESLNQPVCNIIFTPQNKRKNHTQQQNKPTHEPLVSPNYNTLHK
jgi:hypothetical protein